MTQVFIGGVAGGSGVEACYGNNSPAFDRSIDVCVGRLRKKLQDDPRNPSIIRTVRNGGYIFSARITRH